MSHIQKADVQTCPEIVADSGRQYVTDGRLRAVLLPVQGFCFPSSLGSEIHLNIPRHEKLHLLIRVNVTSSVMFAVSTVKNAEATCRSRLS